MLALCAMAANIALVLCLLPFTGCISNPLLFLAARKLDTNSTPGRGKGGCSTACAVYLKWLSVLNMLALLSSASIIPLFVYRDETEEMGLSAWQVVAARHFLASGLQLASQFGNAACFMDTYLAVCSPLQYSRTYGTGAFASKLCIWYCLVSLGVTAGLMGLAHALRFGRLQAYAFLYFTQYTGMMGLLPCLVILWTNVAVYCRVCCFQQLERMRGLKKVSLRVMSIYSCHLIIVLTLSFAFYTSLCRSLFAQQLLQAWRVRLLGTGPWTEMPSTNGRTWCSYPDSKTQIWICFVLFSLTYIIILVHNSCVLFVYLRASPKFRNVFVTQVCPRLSAYAHKERDVTHKQRDVTHKQRDVTQRELDVTQKKRDVTHNERDVTHKERDVIQLQHLRSSDNSKQSEHTDEH